MAADSITTVDVENTFQKTDASVATSAAEVDMVKSYCYIHFACPAANTGIIYISLTGVDPTVTSGFALYPGKDHYHKTQHPIRKYKTLASTASQSLTVIAN